MRAILLLCLFTFSSVFSQIPTDDIKRYLFTNGSLVNEATPGTSDLVAAGNSRTLTLDPLSTPNNAISLNGDQLSAGNRIPSGGSIGNGEVSISFWFKSNTTDSSPRMIISQYGFETSGYYGWSVLLHNGKIKLSSISLINGITITPELVIESASSLADNNWHHVVCIVNKTTFFSGGWTNGPQATLYVDKVIQGSNYSGGATSQPLVYLNPNNKNIVIAEGSSVFTENIDNIRIYNKTLSAAEIQALFYEYTGTFVKLFVDPNATGANNGGSWANAYTSLQQALNVTNNQDIWVKSGTYKPHVSDRATSFVVPSGVNIYGGFNGTESLLSERDWIANPTIISGDLSGNDDANVSFSNPLRNDNSYHLVKANASNILFDGFTFTGGHANGSGADRSGASIVKINTAMGLSIKNSKFENNVSLDAAAGIFADNSVTGTYNFTIENTIFKNNLATYGTSFYFFTSSNNVFNVNVSNSLFENNRTIDNGATKGYAGSAGWFRAIAVYSSINANFVNNTYVNNIDSGTNSYLVNRAIIGLERVGGANVNGKIYNCIFWNNTGVGGATSKAMNNIVDSYPVSIIANNSLDSDNFSTASSKSNIIITDPLFVSSSDFQIGIDSPAKDMGDNTYVSLPTDLNTNPRIDNVTVDMGAYETEDLCNFLINSITDNSAVVGWNSSITTDLLYVISGDPITNGVTMSGIVSNTATLTSLLPNTLYNVYSSATCASSSNAGWYLVGTFMTKGTIYVDNTATGANNGTSWTNAYTSLQQALNAAVTQNVWVKTGTYKPHATDRTVSYTIPTGISVYGGFNGTETLLSQRNWRANPTIISGDLAGNDDATISFTNTLRNDNSYHLIKANANNITIDGFVLSNAHANGAAGDDKIGAAIYKDFNVNNLTVKNCEFKDNVSLNAAAGIFARYNVSGALLVENTKFTNNLSTYGTSFYLYTDLASSTVNVDVSNSLFDGNKAIDNGTTKGFAGSAGWFRAYAANSTINANFINNTYVNNIDTGTYAGTSRRTLGLEKTSTAIMNGKIYNSIFWNNREISNAQTKAVGSVLDAFPTTMIVNNSLDSDNFSNVTSKLNIVTTNPLFVNSSDYQLTATSPAINTGDNSKVPASITEDLLGAFRIFDTTVDMGVYEFGSTVLGNTSFTSFNEFTVYPNPTSGILNIDLDEEIEKIDIYSLLGRKVGTSTNTQMDISNLASGVYLLTIETKDGKVGTKRIVKQ